jgi:hypothetical protein
MIVLYFASNIILQAWKSIIDNKSEW